MGLAEVRMVQPAGSSGCAVSWIIVLGAQYLVAWLLGAWGLGLAALRFLLRPRPARLIRLWTIVLRRLVAHTAVVPNATEVARLQPGGKKRGAQVEERAEEQREVLVRSQFRRGRETGIRKHKQQQDHRHKGRDSNTCGSKQQRHWHEGPTGASDAAPSFAPSANAGHFENYPVRARPRLRHHGQESEYHDKPA